MRSPPLLFFILAVIGALSGLLVSIPFWWGFGTFIAVAAAAFSMPFRFPKALLVCIAVALFLATLASNEKQQFDQILRSILETPNVYEGTLLDVSDSINGDKVGTFEIESSLESSSVKSAFTVALKLTGAACAKNLKNGDTLRIKGKISKARHALSPGQMDGYWFGLSRGVYGRITVSNPNFITVMKAEAPPPWLSQIKQALKDHLSANLAPREAGLMLALIIGDVKLFDDEQQMQYRNIGAGHLLAVSGLQVSILSVIFFRLFLFLFLLIPWVSRRSLARYPTLFVTLVLVWSFVALCGSPPSAFRAGLMTSLMLSASVYAWPTTSMDIFGATGLISLLINPSAVLDPSFWLSYAAVLGLIIAAQVAQLSPSDLLLLNPEKNHAPWKTKIRAMVISSVGAGLLTLPFSAFYFAELSLSGLIVNLFLVPVAGILQTPAILLVAVGTLLDLPWLSAVAAFFAGVLEAMCMTLDNLLGHTQPIMPLSMPGLFMTTLAAILIVASANRDRRWMKAAVAMTCLAVVFVPPGYFSEPRLLATFLPVGQGDAAVLQIPPGRVIVIDGGGNHDDSYNPGERVITPFLRRRNIEVIDAVVLSHPDADHLMGLLPLFKNFEVKELWHSGFDDSHPLMARLLGVAAEYGVKISALRDERKKLMLGDAVFEVISPPERPLATLELNTTNNRSLVLRVSYKGQSILFPGDIEAPIEFELEKTKQDLVATIVKAPHHGSKGASSESFVKSTKASHVVFCTGVNNRFGFPHSQAIKRWKDSGANLWDTAINGETTFRLGGASVEVKPFLAKSEDQS